MKKIILLCLVISLTTAVLAQDNVSIHFAQTFASFKYTDSQGNSDPNMGSEFRSSYGVNYSKVFNSGLFIRPEIGYKNLGASSLLFHQKLDWSLHYLDFNFGIGYAKRIKPVLIYIGAAPYASYLYKANQTLGTDYYDLLADEKIKSGDYGINIFGGLKYLFTEANAVFIEIRNSTGLMQLETNTENGKNQGLYNRAVSFHFGLSFNLVNKRRSIIRSNF